MTGSSLGELTAVVLLSLLFSVKAASIGGKLILFALLLILAALATIGLARAERRISVMGVLDRLSDTTAQLRVRLAVLLLVGLAAAADRLGFEAILGAFLAGAVLRLAEPAADKHPQFHVKLSGLGYGFLIPVSFVNSGVTCGLRALTSHPATLARVPGFLGRAAAGSRTAHCPGVRPGRPRSLFVVEAELARLRAEHIRLRNLLKMTPEQAAPAIPVVPAAGRGPLLVASGRLRQGRAPVRRFHVRQGRPGVAGPRRPRGVPVGDRGARVFYDRLDELIAPAISADQVGAAAVTLAALRRALELARVGIPAG